MIETGFVTLLSGVASVHPDYMPPDLSTPAIVYRREATDKEQTHDGTSNIVAHVFNFVAIEKSYAAVVGVGDSIVTVFEDYEGAIGTASVVNTEVLEVLSLGYFEDSQTWQESITIKFYEQ